jgi:hypothetical protein
MTMTLAEALLRQQERPNPCDPPVARMISLLTSNRPDEARSNGCIDTDDFHDREPVSLTMPLTALSPKE